MGGKAAMDSMSSSYAKDDVHSTSRFLEDLGEAVGNMGASGRVGDTRSAGRAHLHLSALVPSPLSRLHVQDPNGHVGSHGSSGGDLHAVPSLYGRRALGDLLDLDKTHDRIDMDRTRSLLKESQFEIKRLQTLVDSMSIQLRDGDFRRRMADERTRTDVDSVRMQRIRSHTLISPATAQICVRIRMHAADTIEARRRPCRGTLSWRRGRGRRRSKARGPRTRWRCAMRSAGGSLRRICCSRR